MRRDADPGLASSSTELVMSRTTLECVLVLFIAMMAAWESERIMMWDCSWTFVSAQVHAMCMAKSSGSTLAANVRN